MKRLIGLLIAGSVTLAAGAAAGEEATPGQAVIANPGFEDGLTGWTQGGWRVREQRVALSIDAEAPHSGARSVKIHHPQPNDTHVSQSLTVAPDAWYKMSAWIKTDRIEFAEHGRISAALSILDTQAVSPPVAGTQAWAYRELWLHTGKEPATITLACRLGHWNSTVTGTAWFDDVAVERLDHPPQDQGVRVFTLNTNAGLFHERSWGYWGALAALIAAVVGLGWRWAPPRDARDEP